MVQARGRPWNTDLVTLPVRTLVLLFLLWAGYTLGEASAREESRTDVPGQPLTVAYSRNGQPWRVLEDTDRDGQWDRWRDVRPGGPVIVGIIVGAREQVSYEDGAPMSAWTAAVSRARKSAVGYVSNPAQVSYTGLAVGLYILLEMFVRTWIRKGSHT